MTWMRSRLRPMSLLLLLLVAAAGGCGGYGEVSPAAYDYAMALYAISNRRAENKLDEVRQKIDGSRERGDLSGQEAAWLAAIVDDAEAGDWQTANQASRTMLEDQVH